MKTYFIGLGGCGLQTVAELAKRLRREENFEKDYAFTYIDTDGYTRDSINKEGIVIPSLDFIDMGNTVPMAIYRESERTQHSNADAKRFMEWAITQEPGHMVFPNYPLTDGATAQRMVGRTGIYNFYNDVRNELVGKINRFRDVQVNESGRRDLDIWVIASSCGGTGSSMIMDVLYLVNQIGSTIVNGEPNVKLVLYMPQTFVDLNGTNPNHKLNAYACLEEINYFRSNFEEGKPLTFEPFAVRPLPAGTDPISFPLYHFLIPVCAENNFGSKMRVEQFYPTVAEMIYYLNMDGAREKVKGLLSNILEEIAKQRTKGTTSQMIGYGYRAIKKANKELKEYLTRRALYEVVSYGLLDPNRPANFDQLKKEFAHNAILKKLFSINETIHESEQEFQYDTTVETESVEALIKAQMNATIKWDPNNVTGDVVRQKTKQVDDFYNGDSCDQIKKNILALIIKDIDASLNTFIHEYGLNLAFSLLNTVDDFYLEPLCNYVSTTLLPDAIKKASIAKDACSNYVNSSWVQQKMTGASAAGQYIQKYKDAAARAMALKLSMQIIKELTETPSGYLEKLRKGDNKDFAGIRNLQKKLDGDCVDFKDAYAALARAFRATAADVMTVYLPSLAELATGDKNSDWAENNIFDQLYQQSILEQRQIEVGMDKVWVPVRSSETSKGLKDILDKMDPDNNLFIKIIKDKHINLDSNKNSKIIEGIKRAVAELVNADNSPANDWIKQRLSEAIHRHELIPSAFHHDPNKLFDSFKDTSLVPVFFPLKGGVQMPANMRLLFVGENVELASSLGYSATNDKVQQFVEDPRMDDCFMVLRMPAGFSFGMYKYYPEYESFYNSEKYLYGVRHQEFGCHIHRAFNEYGFAISQNANATGARQDISKPVSERVAYLIRCLYYQEVINLLWKNDKNAYNNLFGFATNETQVDMSNLPPELRALLGGGAGRAAAGSDIPNPFISFSFDAAKFMIHFQMREVTFNPTTNYLEVGSDVKNFDFDKEHSQQCKAFVEQLLTMPESLFRVADYLAQKFDIQKNEMLHEALKRVHGEAMQRLLNAVDENSKPTFAFCYMFWKSNHASDDKLYIEAIENAMGSL